MNQQSICYPFTSLVKDKSRAAEKRHESGGKVAGYLSNTIPIELIHAANVMPFHLFGDPTRPTPLADLYLEPAFDPITRSILDKILAGDFYFLDMIILPRANDALHRLYYYLCELKRQDKGYPVPELFLVDLLHSPWYSSTRYNRARLIEFQAYLAKQIGSAIRPEAVSESIRIYNHVRGLLRQFTRERARLPQSITGAISHAVYSAARSMAVEEFTDILSELLSQLNLIKPETGKRLVVTGNGMDTPDLHHLIDQLGSTVVGDYHAYGNHFLVGRVDESQEPVSALSEHYHRETKSFRTFRPNPRDLLDFAKQQYADGILFYYIEKEEALTWHYPKQKQVAEADGFKTILLCDQPYLLDTEKIVSTLQKFIHSL